MRRSVFFLLLCPLGSCLSQAADAPAAEITPQPTGDGTAFLFALAVFLTLVIIYFGLASRRRGDRQPGLAAENAVIAIPSRVARNVVAALLAFVIIDAGIFHSGLYSRTLALGSYAGRFAITMLTEAHRAPSGLQEVAFVGDSRVALAFSARQADALAANERFKFLNFSVRGSSLRVWYYLLREVDPNRNRYRAIVIPQNYSDPDLADAADTTTIAPALRYSDAFSFSASFWSGASRRRALMACLLRGSAYRADIADLLGQPLSRAGEFRTKRAFEIDRYNQPGPSGSLAGLSYEPRTKKLNLPPNLTLSQRNFVTRSVLVPSPEQSARFVRLRETWMEKIVQAYSNSRTAVVMVLLPRGPLGRPVQPERFADEAAFTFAGHNQVLQLDPKLFLSLETPADFYDGVHLNAAGQQKFTELFTSEICRLLNLSDREQLSGVTQHTMASP